MSHEQNPYPVPTQPASAGAVSVAAPETAAETPAPAPGKAKRWLAGAMLVTVGLVAGSGATYAVTAHPTSEVPGYGYGRDGYGGPPPGSGGSDGDGTTDGEPT